MEIECVSDILICKNGELYPMRSNKIAKAGNLETFGAGSGVVCGDKLYVLEGVVKRDNQIRLVLDETTSSLQFIPEYPVVSAVKLKGTWRGEAAPLTVELLPGQGVQTIDVSDKIGHILNQLQIESVDQVEGNTSDFMYNYGVDEVYTVPNNTYPGLLFYVPFDPVHQAMNLIDQVPLVAINDLTYSEEGAYFSSGSSHVCYHSGVNLKKDFTLYCWIKPMTNNVDQYIGRGVMGVKDTNLILGLSNEDDNGYANGKPFFGYNHFIYSSGHYTVGDFVLTKGIWYELIGVHDYVHKKLRFYINKSLQTALDGNIPSAINYNSELLDLYLGGTGSSDHFVGYMKEVKIFDRALSEAEIQLL